MRTTTTRLLALALVAAGATACGPDAPTATATVPGVANVMLESALPVGAVLAEVSGPGIESIRAGNPRDRIFMAATPPGAPMRVALVGERLDGQVLQVRVADARTLPGVSVRVLQAADDRNALVDAGRVTLRVAIR